MEVQKKLRLEAIKDFQNKYRGVVTSGDLQTFILGYTAAEENIPILIENKLNQKELLYKTFSWASDLTDFVNNNKNKIKIISITQNAGSYFLFYKEI